MERKSSVSHGLRSAAIFITIALLCQLLFVFLFTPNGLSVIYPTILRVSSEKIESDASFAEYYDVKDDYSSGDIFFLGADLGVGESYTVIIDYLRFLKQNADVCILALDISDYKAGLINDCIFSEGEAAYMENIAALRSVGGDTDDFYDFVRALYNINSTLTPKRKINVVSNKINGLYRDTVSRLKDNVMFNHTGDVVINKTLNISDPAELISYIKENEQAFREYMDEEMFDSYMTIAEHMEADDYDEWQYAEKLGKLYSGVPMLWVCSRELIDAGSKFYGYVDEFEAEYRAVQIRYSKCTRVNIDKTTSELDEISIPFAFENEIFFVFGGKTRAFLDYYRRIANPFENEKKSGIASALDDFATNDFFIVCRSGPAEYGAAEQ